MRYLLLLLLCSAAMADEHGGLCCDICKKGEGLARTVHPDRVEYRGWLQVKADGTYLIDLGVNGSRLVLSQMRVEGPIVLTTQRLYWVDAVVPRSGDVKPTWSIDGAKPEPIPLDMLHHPVT